MTLAFTIQIEGARPMKPSSVVNIACASGIAFQHPLHMKHVWAEARISTSVFWYGQRGKSTGTMSQNHWPDRGISGVTLSQPPVKTPEKKLISVALRYRNSSGYFGNKEDASC